MFRLVLWLTFVCFSSHGYPHGGRVIPVNKRSDYSMYDNQFFSVGDTALDNEVTDCALVRHQYARGYIRLREFLERMEGCGRKGLAANVAGIAASTKDAINYPSSSSTVSKVPAVKTAPFKPRPIGEVIENKDQQKPKAAAYHNQGLKPQLPIQEQSAQRSQASYNNFGFFNQENGPLSYSPNPATNSVQSPLARKLISQHNMNIPQKQALHNLANTKNQGFPDPQRYYSDQAAAMSRPTTYTAPVAVGQPLVKPNPNPLAYHQQIPLTSTGVTPPNQLQADQPADQHVKKVNQLIKKVTSQSVTKPVKQVSKVESGKIRDDIGGGQVYDEGVQDEANEAEIDNQESDPLPPETSFTYNPRLEEEDSSKKEDAKIEAANTNPYNMPNIPASTPYLNSVPGENADRIHSDDLSNTTISSKDPTQTPQTAQVTEHEQKPENKLQLSAAKKIQNVQQVAHDTTDTTKRPKNAEAHVQNPINKAQNANENNGDDLAGNSEANNNLEEFLKPAIANNVKQDEPVTPPTTKKKGLAINLGVLKNRISNSKDIGFLKRMLTLIKKITHHKDFNKLGGVQKDAIVEAGEAVHNAVAKNSNIQRSFIQPRPPQWKPGDYTSLGYTSSSSSTQNDMQAVLQRNTQKSVIQTHPPKWKPGDYTGQSFSYTSPQVNYASPTYSTNAQYSTRQPQITKKFQIERNPYNQAQVQRPAAYQPPYFSLQRLNYGLYNGNVP